MFENQWGMVIILALSIQALHAFFWTIFKVSSGNTVNNFLGDFQTPWWSIHFFSKVVKIDYARNTAWVFFCGYNFFESNCNDLAVECKVDLLFIQFLFALPSFFSYFTFLHHLIFCNSRAALLFIILLWKKKTFVNQPILVKNAHYFSKKLQQNCSSKSHFFLSYAEFQLRAFEWLYWSVRDCRIWL